MPEDLDRLLFDVDMYSGAGGGTVDEVVLLQLIDRLAACVLVLALRVDTLVSPELSEGDFLTLTQPQSKRTFPFDELLYKSRCGECLERLVWTARFDADGTVHRTECCGKLYSMYPDTFRLEIEEEWPAEKEDRRRDGGYGHE